MMKAVQAIFVAALLSALAACGSNPTTANADAYQPKNEAPAEVADQTKPEPVKAEPVKAPEPEPVVIPSGTKLRVALLESVSSDKSSAGDVFLSSLTQPVVVNGKTVLAKGTKIRGRVVDAQGAGRVKGRASLELALTQIVRDEGKAVNIATKPFTQVAEPTKKRDAGIIGGGAGLGAAIGAIAGGGKGAAIGAIAGGGAGTGAVLATKGKEIRMAPEHLLTFTLSSSVKM